MDGKWIGIIAIVVAIAALGVAVWVASDTKTAIFTPATTA